MQGSVNVAQPVLDSTVYTAIEDSATNHMLALRIGEDLEESSRMVPTPKGLKSEAPSSPPDVKSVDMSNMTLNSSQKPKFTIF